MIHCYLTSCENQKELRIDLKQLNLDEDWRCNGAGCYYVLAYLTGLVISDEIIGKNLKTDVIRHMLECVNLYINKNIILKVGFPIYNDFSIDLYNSYIQDDIRQHMIVTSGDANLTSVIDDNFDNFIANNLTGYSIMIKNLQKWLELGCKYNCEIQFY